MIASATHEVRGSYGRGGGVGCSPVATHQSVAPSSKRLSLSDSFLASKNQNGTWTLPSNCRARHSDPLRRVVEILASFADTGRERCVYARFDEEAGKDRPVITSLEDCHILVTNARLNVLHYCHLAIAGESRFEQLGVLGEGGEVARDTGERSW